MRSVRELTLRPTQPPAAHRKIHRPESRSSTEHSYDERMLLFLFKTLTSRAQCKGLCPIFCRGGNRNFTRRRRGGWPGSDFPGGGKADREYGLADCSATLDSPLHLTRSLVACL